MRVKQASEVELSRLQHALSEERNRKEALTQDLGGIRQAMSTAAQVMSAQRSCSARALLLAWICVLCLSVSFVC